MYESLTAMVFNQLLWEFAYILLNPQLMSSARVSQFHWRLVNQQRQISDCVFRLFDSPKYLTTLRSNISPCQKATTLILILLYNPSFYLWKASKIFLGTAVFCLGCLLKSATVTSFSKLHQSRNSGSRLSFDQVNLHFIALYTRWLIKKAKKCEKLSRFLGGMENFTLKEIHVARRNGG